MPDQLLREMWKPTRVRIDDVIILTERPGIVLVSRPFGRCTQLNRYSVGKVTISWEREIGSYWGDPFVVLYTCRGMSPERLDGGKLFPSQLREVPAWLSNIIERSRPRED